MRLSTMISTSLVALGLLALPSTAHAQNIGDLTLRLEPGVAFPLGAPQDQRFTPGFNGAVKIDVDLLPWLDTGPVVSELVLPSQVSGVSAGTATYLGGFVRLHRSHAGTETGLKAISPWVEGSLGYNRTGSFDRLGWYAQAGLALPTSAAHNIWAGPFIQQSWLHQDGGYVLQNANDSKTFIVGLSFEFGAKNKPAPEPVVVEKVVVKEAPCPPTPEPVVVAKPVPAIQTEFVVRYPFDSNELKSSQQNILDQATASFNALCTNRQPPCKVLVDGFSSSEGQLKHNIVLSQKRADAAAAYLTGKGVSKATITSTGKGIDNPVGNNATAAGRSANRRAEVVIKIVQGAK